MMNLTEQTCLNKHFLAYCEDLQYGAAIPCRWRRAAMKIQEPAHHFFCHILVSGYTIIHEVLNIRRVYAHENKDCINHCPVMLFAVSCAHSVTYTEIRKATPDKKVADKITVYEIGDPVKTGYIELGTVWLGESGFSQSCGYNDALYLARQKAREVGADAVQVTRVEKPNW